MDAVYANLIGWESLDENNFSKGKRLVTPKEPNCFTSVTAYHTEDV